jgi:hypothetical protein
VVCFVPVPGPTGCRRRARRVKTYPAMTRSLIPFSGWRAGWGVTRVVMDATADYGKPPVYRLAAPGLETWLVDAGNGRHLPGSVDDRPVRRGRAVQGLAGQGRRPGHDPPEFRPHLVTVIVRI